MGVGMIVYHGSNKSFDKFVIDKSLVRWNTTESNEGLGIYFCLNRDTAKSYGKYLYTIDIPNSSVTDFRKQSVCDSLIDNIGSILYLRYGFNIGDYVNTVLLRDFIMCGHISICNGIGKEIGLYLDSTEEWYNSYKADISDIQSLVDSYIAKTYKAYLFEYQIKDIGVIKDVNLANIINREEV